jgi:hypothetical protein
MIHHGLKAWKLRKRKRAAMHMHFAVLGATPECRDDLLGVQQPVWVKGAFDCGKGNKLFALKLNAHLIDFFHAYAMLAGDGATDFDT